MSRKFLEKVFGVEFTDGPVKLDSHYCRESFGKLNAQISYLDFDFEPKVEGNVLFHSIGTRKDRRDWWVVEYPEGVLKFRLCSAMEGSGYEAFAVANFIPIKHEEYDDNREHFIEAAADLAMMDMR